MKLIHRDILDNENIVEFDNIVTIIGNVGKANINIPNGDLFIIGESVNATINVKGFCDAKSAHAGPQTIINAGKEVLFATKDFAAQINENVENIKFESEISNNNSTDSTRIFNDDGNLNIEQVQADSYYQSPSNQGSPLIFNNNVGTVNKWVQGTSIQITSNSKTRTSSQSSQKNSSDSFPSNQGSRPIFNNNVGTVNKLVQDASIHITRNSQTPTSSQPFTSTYNNNFFGTVRQFSQAPSSQQHSRSNNDSTPKMYTQTTTTRDQVREINAPSFPMKRSS